jgi:hypothetical protein
MKGFEKYIDKNEIKNDMSSYKILTPDGNGCNKCFGNTFIALPNEVHSKTYISFNVDTKTEAESLLSYLKCKFANFLLYLRKNSQHTSEMTCKWIPLPPLTKIWSDDKLYKYYNLTEEEINLIKETKIAGYKDLNKKKTTKIKNKSKSNDKNDFSNSESKKKTVKKIIKNDIEKQKKKVINKEKKIVKKIESDSDCESDFSN